MDVFQAIQSRRSIRRFKQDPVPDELIIKVLEAARQAPSWGNVQPWRFILIRDPQTKSKIARIARQRQIERAPVVIACCGDLNSWKHQSRRLEELALAPKERIEEVMQDPLINVYLLGKDVMIKRTCEQVMFAIQNMMLAATGLGLGSCCIAGRLPTEIVGEILGLPDHAILVALVTLGYPDEFPNPRPRLELDQLVFQERWGNPYPGISR